MYTSVLKGRYLVLLVEVNSKVNDLVSSRMVSLVINTWTQLVLRLYCDCPDTNVRYQDEIVVPLPMIATETNKWQTCCIVETDRTLYMYTQMVESDYLYATYQSLEYI